MGLVRSIPWQKPHSDMRLFHRKHWLADFSVVSIARVVILSKERKLQPTETAANTETHFVVSTAPRAGVCWTIDFAVRWSAAARSGSDCTTELSLPEIMKVICTVRGNVSNLSHWVDVTVVTEPGPAAAGPDRRTGHRNGVSAPRSY